MPPQSLSLSVVRPDDFLMLGLTFEQVQVTPPTATQPGKIAGTANSRLIVHLQPQHIAEQAFFQASQDHQEPVPSDEKPALPGHVLSRLAGPSRLAFILPATESIELTLPGVLAALQRLPLNVSAVSRWQPPGCANLLQMLLPRPHVAPPAASETAIEAPYRLILSPDEKAHWRHATEPVTHGTWTELWHTRIGSARPSGDPRVRAIWSPDFQPTDLQPPDDTPFRMSLRGRYRNQIVHLTSNLHLAGFLPSTLETDQFTLSALGAWLEVEGTWIERPHVNPSTKLTVENWRHEAMMGRDQYARVVEAGYLFPYGHRAVLVEITERKFLHRDGVTTAGNVAYLYQRKFIVVRERTRHYTHRDMLFRSVTVKTRVTPNLVDPGTGIASLADSAFWPRVDTGGGPEDFEFHFVGTDWEGRGIEWTSPVIFVNDVADAPANIGPVLDEYNNTTPVTSSRRQRPLQGQTVAMAPAKKPLDTAVDAADFSLEAIALSGADGPHFRPAMKQANVDVPAVKQLLGKSAPSTIEWEPTYVAGSGSGIGNKGDVFAKVTSVSPLDFDVEKVGGMVAPNLQISGLSRSLGPVGGAVDQMVNGKFDPQDVFPNIKLLGSVTLFEILKILTFNVASSTAGKIPGLTTKRVGDVIKTRYVWTIGSTEMVQNHPLFRPKPSSEFRLEAVADAPLDGSKPHLEVRGALTDFSAVLLPLPDLELVEIEFEALEFESLPDLKPDVTVRLGEIKFKGILEFVNKLEKYIPLDGFDDPPNLELVGPPHPGVKVGYTLGIPDIGVGVMTLQNISLAAGFFLPFGDSPLGFRFAFCERQQPFILTVSLFGGGGFFAIDIGLDGVKMLEASLEFGASAAIDLGVASGEATIMAGFYFQMVGADYQLTGYFRAHGSLSVLGIITVSLEFYLGLTYATKGISPHGGTLWGQATLTVKIEILFFSISVGVSMEREFAGSDPKFNKMLTQGDWAEYADAFAAYA